MFKTNRHRVLLTAAVAAGAASVMAASTAFAAVEWTTTETPDVGSEYTLEGLDVIADDDVWAVGRSSGTVAIHWDGTAWQHTETPKGWDLIDVSASASDDVWAVGRTESGSGVSHWTGDAWEAVDSPAPDLPDDQNPGLYTVDAHETGKAWAGGCGESDTTSTAFAQQWDGSNWKTHALPIPDGVKSSCVFDINYAADDDVWVFGTTWQQNGWALHWDGSKWSEQETPKDTDDSVQLTGSHVTQDGQVCASGYTIDADMVFHPYLICRDEGTWAEVKTPELDGSLGDIGSDGNGGMYLVGSREESAVVLGFDGETVTEETPPNGEVALASIDSGPDSSRVWVVGAAGPRGFAAHSG